MNNLSLSSPKISCIVPVYNVEKYLRRSLDSILAQTFTDFECICVDDGSSDGSGKILDEYAEKDSRFVVIHKDNGGVSSARNAGLDVARGEWIAFVDADDWISTDMLENIYIETRKTRFSLDMLMFDAWFSDGSEHDAQFKPTATQVFTFDSEKPVPFCGYVWNKAFRSDFLHEHSISFPEGIQWGEDGYFAVHTYVEAEKILWISKKLYNYNTGNVTSLTKTDVRLRKRWDDNLSVLHGLLEYIERKGMSLSLQETLRRFKWCSKATYFHFYGTKGDFEFWRNLFSEENAHFYDCKGWSALFYRAVLRRLDWFAILLIWAKSVVQSINYKLRCKRKSITQGGSE
ncbi:MAG: glycosyltransferase [Treponema sp.]|nr:glycosyltransferase [Treponema sp.]